MSAPDSHRTSLGTVKNLDVLKGVAILLVVAYHSFGQSPVVWLFDVQYTLFFLPQNTPPVSDLIPQIHNLKDLADTLVSVICGFGYQGVHLFIIASGLGLTLSFLRKGIKLPNWYLRRAERILPMYWVSLALVYRLSQAWHLFYFFAPSTSLSEIVLQVLCLNVLVPGYFSGLNYPLWFIGLLFQLYLFFPLLIKLFNRWNPLRIFLASVLVTLVFRLIGLYYISPFHPPFSVGGLFLCRLAEFVFGICFGFHIRREAQNWIGPLAKLAVPLYIVGILLHLAKPWTAMCDTVIGISLFLIVWKVVDYLPALTQRSLTFLGKHSLGIFLFHSILIRPAYEMSHLVTDNKYILLFSVILLCAVSGAFLDMFLSKLQRTATDSLQRTRISKSGKVER